MPPCAWAERPHAGAARFGELVWVERRDCVLRRSEGPPLPWRAAAFRDGPPLAERGRASGCARRPVAGQQAIL